jgi:hypothetical protein
MCRVDVGGEAKQTLPLSCTNSLSLSLAVPPPPLSHTPTLTSTFEESDDEDAGEEAAAPTKAE